VDRQPPSVATFTDANSDGDAAQWGMLLRNHDELDQGRLSTARRAVAFKSFGQDNNRQLYNRGIRRRLAPSPMCTLPGTPVLRYGDEIGMGGNLSARAQLPAVRKEVLCGADLL